MDDFSVEDNRLIKEESDSGVSDDMVTVPDLNVAQSVSKDGIEESNERLYDLSRTEDISSLVATKNETLIKNQVEKHIWSLIEKEKDVFDGNNFLFLFDESNSISRGHVERIYSSLMSFDQKKDIILFLKSKGGHPEPAYLISRLCNKFKKKKFIVSIPAEAKSAATLLSFGADEIHMGPMSELGPIDIQIDGIPMLSVSSALNKIASIVQDYPKSAPMFSDYLTKNLSISHIGYYDRVTESAVQYAQILLAGKHNENTKSVGEIANHFTNHYKDHGFVIDVDESKNILGSYMVKDGTDIYDIGSRILNFINNVEFAFLLSGVKKKVVFVGAGCEILLDSPDRDEIFREK
ncbi:hypothetical protein H4F33_20710 [Pectobacterium brasiliense]|uniref:SDH family Clp fold serine proteinase n=1 Tax=Pectobacterium brasiliense TaxID=180957 RepID=UPI001969527A|nr:hypothetical protein [Pectobacterium brasiliense]MBN3074470.1 hypothetical protein [Pectobacterium brasiliense]MBN3170514.1 hypothetical protein [Pectobacterium brasiliense]